MNKISDFSKKTFDFQFDFGNMPIANSYKKNSGNLVYKCLIGVDFQYKILKNINSPNPKKLFTSNYPYNQSLSKNFSKYLRDLASEIYKEEKLNLLNKSIIEIGSCDGTFLEFFNEKKIKHLGIEPTKNNHLIAKKNGINSMCEFFNQISSKKIKKKFGSTDVIFGSNVIGHINKIDDTFKAVKNLLSQNGTFIFENIYVLDLINNKAYDQLYDEHVYTLSVTAINKLCKKNNLQLFKVKKNNIQGGSMRYYISRNQKKKKLKSVGNFLNFEKKHNFFTKKGASLFYDECINSKKMIIKTLEDLKNMNKVVYGYGASAKSTFLINFCRIQKEDIKYIFDNVPEKIGSYIPGTKIEIIDEKQFDKKNFEYVIVFSWNHFEEIYNKHKLRTKKNKIKWIIPFPKVSFRN